MQIRLLSILPIFVFFLLQSASAKEIKKNQKLKCQVDRIVFDIGSGSTKAKAANVDICQGFVLREYLDKTIKITFKEELKKSPEGKLSEEFLDNAVISFEALKDDLEKSILGAGEYKLKGPSSIEYIAVGTAGLREAKNAFEFVERIKKKTGIEIQTLSQEQEARLGLLAVKSKMKIKQKTGVLVWDIGGGSQQMTLQNKKKLSFAFAEYASIGFKNKVIEEIKKEKNPDVKSPNPMTKEEIEMAVKLSQDLAKVKYVGGKKLIKKAKSVFGVGGVWGQSLPKSIGSDLVTQDNLLAALQKYTNKGDLEVGGDFAETDVTNLAFVLGHMRIFGIQKVRAVKVNLTDGLLVQSNM